MQGEYHSKENSMKKTKRNTRKAEVFLGSVAGLFIALTLHFAYVIDTHEQSHRELNGQYTDVLIENEELRFKAMAIYDKNVELQDAAEKSSGLVEQSQMEIERLNTEITNLNQQVSALKEESTTKSNRIEAFRKKVDELEKKSLSAQ